MLAYKKTIEQEIEIEIARIEKELAAFEPTPIPPVITLMDKNVISASFNTTASSDMNRYLRDMPRREGLLRSLEHYKRRLYAVRLHNMHSSNFAFAA